MHIIVHIIVEYPAWWFNELSGIGVDVGGRAMISYKHIYKAAEIRTFILAWNSDSIYHWYTYGLLNY